MKVRNLNKTRIMMGMVLMCAMTMGVTSCGKEDPYEVARNATKRLAKVTENINYGETENVEEWGYDAMGRVTSIEYSTFARGELTSRHVMTVEHHRDSVVAKTYDTKKEMAMVEKALLLFDGAGRIVENRVYKDNYRTKYAYNSANQLVSEETYYGATDASVKVTYTWKDGNMVRRVRTASDGAMTVEENSFGSLLTTQTSFFGYRPVVNWMDAMGWFGVKNSHLVTRTRTTEDAGSSVKEFHDYVFDQDGRLTGYKVGEQTTYKLAYR